MLRFITESSDSRRGCAFYHGIDDNYIKSKTTKYFIGKHLFPHMLQTTLMSLFFGPVELQSINLTFTFNITVSQYYHFELLLSGGQLIVLWKAKIITISLHMITSYPLFFSHKIAQIQAESLKNACFLH